MKKEQKIKKINNGDSNFPVDTIHHGSDKIKTKVGEFFSKISKMIFNKNTSKTKISNIDSEILKHEGKRDISRTH